VKIDHGRVVATAFLAYRRKRWNISEKSVCSGSWAPGLTSRGWGCLKYSPLPNGPSLRWDPRGGDPQQRIASRC